MTERDESEYTDEEAAAIWRRAARLQMEAAQRLEERSRSLIAGKAERLPGGATMRQSDVEAAALEAGISAEYVQLAQAELGAQAGSAEALGGWENRAATRMLGTANRSIELSRRIAAPAETVVTAMQRVFPGHPYYLALRDVVGGPVAAGGVLVVSIPSYGVGATVTTPLIWNAAAVDLKQVLVRVIRGAADDACEVVLTGDMHFGVRRNWRVGAGLAGALGLFGGGLTTAVAVNAFAVAAGLAMLPAVAGAAAVGGLSAWGYGVAYRHYLAKLVENLEELLQRVDVDARTGGGFGAPQVPPPGGGGSPVPPVLPG